jgi:hypothetical protein
MLTAAWRRSAAAMQEEWGRSKVPSRTINTSAPARVRAFLKSTRSRQKPLSGARQVCNSARFARGCFRCVQLFRNSSIVGGHCGLSLAGNGVCRPNRDAVADVVSQVRLPARGPSIETCSATTNVSGCSSRSGGAEGGGYVQEGEREGEACGMRSRRKTADPVI